MKKLRKRLTEAFKEAGLIVVNPHRCGGEPTIGETRFRLRELFEFIDEYIESTLESVRLEERPAHYCLNVRQGDYRCVFCGEIDIRKPCKKNPFNEAVKEQNKRIKRILK